MTATIEAPPRTSITPDRPMFDHAGEATAVLSCPMTTPEEEATMSINGIAYWGTAAGINLASQPCDTTRGDDCVARFRAIIANAKRPKEDMDKIMRQALAREHDFTTEILEYFSE